MQLNRKRSLAAFALLAAFNGLEARFALAQTEPPEPAHSPAPTAARAAPDAPAESDATLDASEAVPDLRLLRLPATAGEASGKRNGPSSLFTGQAAVDLYTNDVQAQAVLRRRFGLRTMPPDQSALYTNAVEAARAFRERYGLGGPREVAPPVRPVRQADTTARGSKTEAKLKRIVVPEAAFNNLRLGEVLRFLSDESVKRDPDEIGVNFLINPNVRPVRLFGGVNPATGRPMAAPAERFDAAAVKINFNLPLRHVTLRDLLDAIVLVADHPIE